MTAKEYLQQYKSIMARILTIERELSDLRSASEGVTSKIDGMPRGSRVSDRTARLATDIADYESDLEDLWHQALRVRAGILRTLFKVDDPIYFTLLHRRYILCLKWEDICDELHYSYSWVSKTLHERALKEIDKILKSK